MSGGPEIDKIIRVAKENPMRKARVDQKKIVVLSTIIIIVLVGCTAAPQIEVSYDPDQLKFDGAQAREIEDRFTGLFPNRDSGEPNNRRAIDWLNEQYTALGLDCQIDSWEVINYSKPVPQTNLVCKLEGQNPDREIVLSAHHDQAPTTIEGADNDASGVAIMVHLVEILAGGDPPRYSIVFLTADGEEYGNLGTRRFLKTHPDLQAILAAVSLDNLGRPYYNGMDMEATGQFRNYGALWLALAARDAAAASDQITWEVYPDPIDEQLTSQIAPSNAMDQGPFVARGIPSFGFAGHKPNECLDLHYDLWHDPRDAMEVEASAVDAGECLIPSEGRVVLQSGEALGQSGLIVEALVRQLESMGSFPEASAPYLYFAGSQQVAGPGIIYLIGLMFVGIFFLGAYLIGGRDLRAKLQGWSRALPHFLALWLPLVGGVILLYLFTDAGLMLKFDLYPATTKDPYLLEPRYIVYVLLILGMVFFFLLGRRLVSRFGPATPPGHSSIKSLALLVIGIGALYPLIVNPMSLIICLPLLLWLLNSGQGGLWRIWDIILFLLGGLLLYFVIYVNGWVFLRYDWAFIWYMLHMFTAGMVSFATVLVSMGMIGAGLSMIVNPARGRARGLSAARQVSNPPMEEAGG
jgi:Peptidase family M28